VDKLDLDELQRGNNCHRAWGNEQWAEDTIDALIARVRELEAENRLLWEQRRHEPFTTLVEAHIHRAMSADAALWRAVAAVEAVPPTPEEE